MGHRYEHHPVFTHFPGGRPPWLFFRSGRASGADPGRRQLPDAVIGSRAGPGTLRPQRTTCHS
ncbi:hypothetical protein D3C81_2054160 [compost metagenome]